MDTLMARPCRPTAPYCGEAELEHVRTLAEQAAEDLADASAEEVIRWAVDTFGARICVTSSMTDAVIIHLASAVHPGIDVVFLDTGYHFAETIGTRDAVEAVYPIHLVNVTPSRTVAEQDAELGPRLFGRNPDLCCYLRKVEPLERALAGYDAWITGVRRDETSNRRQSRVVEWDDRREMIKVNPLSTTAIPRSAARPARPGLRRARTRAAAGGPAPARPNAAFMPDRSWRPLRAGDGIWLEPAAPVDGLVWPHR
jgi:phosphoadenylyl-sulfate reductase (thioredoxin)